MNRGPMPAYLENCVLLLASIIFFAVGLAFGVAVANRFPGLADHFGDSITGFLKTFRGLPKPQLAVAIFLNNSVKTLAAILLGLAIGIVPTLFLLVNGVVLGVVFCHQPPWRVAVAVGIYLMDFVLPGAYFSHGHCLRLATLF